MRIRLLAALLALVSALQPLPALARADNPPGATPTLSNSPGTEVTPASGNVGSVLHAWQTFMGYVIDNAAINGCPVFKMLNDQAGSPPDAGVVAVYYSHHILPFSTIGTTHSNTTIDGISSTANMYVGQLVSGAALGIDVTNTNNVYITAVSSNSITISAAATLSATGSFTAGCAAHPITEFQSNANSFVGAASKLFLGADGKIFTPDNQLTLAATKCVGWQDVSGAPTTSDVNICRPASGTLCAGNGTEADPCSGRIYSAVIQAPYATVSTVAASTTVYFGPMGAQAVNTLGPFSSPGVCTIIGFSAAATQNPGVGETYTYTIMKGGVAQTMTGQAAGNAQNTVNVTTNPVSLALYDNYQLRLTTSSGAAAANHSGAIRLKCAS